MIGVEDTNLRKRIEILEALQWRTLGGLARLRRLTFLQQAVTANVNTMSLVFVTLLTQPIVLDPASVVLIRASVHNSNNSAMNRTNFFRVRRDGVPLQGASCLSAHPNQTLAVTIEVLVTGLAPGAHTIDLQWRVSGGQARIRPVAVPDEEHGTLTVEILSP